MHIGGETGHFEQLYPRDSMDNPTDPQQGRHSDPVQQGRKSDYSSGSRFAESHASPQSSSSSTATEDDYDHSPAPRGKQGPSQRLLPPERSQEMGQSGQNGQYSDRRPDDSFSRRLPIQAAQSRSPMPQMNHRRASGGMVDGFTQFQGQSVAQGRFGQGGFESHQLQPGTGDPRRSNLSQFSATASFDTSAPSYGNFNNPERFPPRNNEEMMYGRYDNTGINDHDDDDSEYTEIHVNRGQKRKRKSRSKGKQAERWDAMFSRLAEFKRIHGHCLVPNRYVHDPSLGAWVSTQRRHYKILMSGEEGVTSPMTPSRAARLSSIGFAWQTSDPRHVPWETRFQQLLEYKAKHGNCVVPIGWKENPRLSNWVSAQRQEYKLFREGKKCRIDEQKINALNAVGFVWEAQRGTYKRKAVESDNVSDEVAPQAFAAQGNAGNISISDILNSLGFPADNLNGGEERRAVVSQVLALLAAQQQPSGLQTTQKRSSGSIADAALALLQQSGAPNASTTMNNSADSLAGGDVSSKTAPQPLAAPPLLLNHAMNQRERLAASAIDHQARVMAATIAEKEPIKIRRQFLSERDEQIISKHVSFALSNEPGVDERSAKKGVERILGAIRGAGNVSPPPDEERRVPNANPAQKNERLGRMPSGPRFSPLSPQEPSTDTKAEATTNKSDSSESEASKFGVALQIGQVVGKPAAADESESNFRRNSSSPESSMNAIHPLRDKEQESATDHSTPPPMGDTSAFPDSRRPSDFTTTSMSAAGLKGTSNLSSTRSSFSFQQEDEGLYADADEEDEDEGDDETWQGSDDV